MSDACERCGNRSEHSPIGDARCALRTAVRADVQLHAAGLDKPPRKPMVDDLTAHLFTVYGDEVNAHRAALTVLDLGWRPAVFQEAS